MKRLIVFACVLGFTLFASLASGAEFYWPMFVPATIGASAGQTCSSDRLDLCEDQGSCTNVGGWWYGNNCHSNKSINQIKTESLDGCWRFIYTIISTWTTNVCLDKSTVEESSTEPNVFFIYGSDEYGFLTNGGYWPDGDYYHVLVTGSIIWEYFTFNFTSSSIVSGCYYQYNPDDGSLSRCYAMTGGRTSKTVAEKLALTSKEHIDLLKQNEVNELSVPKANHMLDENLSDAFNALKASIGEH